MEPSELESWKQQAKRLKVDVELVTLEIHTSLEALQKHHAWFKQLENQHELALCILKSRLSQARVSQYRWVSEYCQQEIILKQKQLTEIKQRHVEETRSMEAKQSQLIARCQTLVQQLQELNQQLLQFELMNLIHP